MSTMDALPEVEELIAKAAEWGHKAVSLLTMGMCRVSRMALKQPSWDPADLWDGKANIVEDKVPITYNEVIWTSMKRPMVLAPHA